MACVYKYKNKTFDTEAQLNDYLLMTSTLKPILGDIVFDLKGAQPGYFKSLKNASAIYKQLKDSGFQISSVKSEVEPEDLDDSGVWKYPYISVTDLIHTMSGRFKALVFPIFKSDEYWKHKYILYSQGIVDPYELQFISDLVNFLF